jgi:dolichyl-phosphate-mannose--protein O-mannosyl transferase
VTTTVEDAHGRGDAQVTPPDAMDEDSLAVRDDVTGRLERARGALIRPMPSDRVWGWLLPLLITALGGSLRLWELGRPDRITFDETYYVKGGISLWNSGIELDAIENADTLLGQGNGDVFQRTADYVVHPELGKWIIGAGTHFFGITPTAWRLGTAILGTLLILVVARAGRRLFRSTFLGCAAALLLAVDGTAIALSRVALLDGILAFFVVVAFACLLVDRDHARRTLAERLHTTPRDERGRWIGAGPWLGWRPWRIAAGLMLGCALGTKWSALWFIAAFGVMSVLWDAAARRTAGLPQPFTAMLKRDALPAFATLVVLAVVVYLATWTGWFLSEDGWDRTWADDRTTSWPFIPDAVRSLWHWHASMFNFHATLTSSHPYESNAWGWLLQTRPTAIHYSDVANCGADQCTSAITALGNPVLWWSAVAALPYLVWQWAARRDWRVGAILAGFAAGWVPWLVLYNDRTVFQFYAVVIAPFAALGVAFVLGRVLGPAEASARRRSVGAALVGAFLALALLAGAFFYPVWSAEPISYADWARRMWFRSWI